MTKGASVTVQGDTTLRLTLAKASADLANMTTAANMAGRTIATRAQGRAPKRSGRLASSIHATADGSDAAVGSNLIYAPVIHNGWAAHNITPNPFLVPIAEDTQPVWLNYYRADLGRAISQVRGA